MESIIKKSLHAFFEKVHKHCQNGSIESLVETFEIKGLTDEDIKEIYNYLDEIDDYLDELYFFEYDDTYSWYNICETSFWEHKEGCYRHLGKSIWFDLSVDYCENILSFTANFYYYYERWDGSSTLPISERDYKTMLADAIYYDDIDEDEDDYFGNTPCEMCYVGDGAWCDDDGDNWDFN